MEDTPNNVINFPMTREMRFRHSMNKSKAALFEPEQVTDKEEPKAEEAPEDKQTRPEHFDTGQQEAKLHSFRNQQIKRNMKAGDESVDRMINMEDPTKD